MKRRIFKPLSQVRINELSYEIIGLLDKLPVKEREAYRKYIIDYAASARKSYDSFYRISHRSPNFNKARLEEMISAISALDKAMRTDSELGLLGMTILVQPPFPNWTIGDLVGQGCDGYYQTSKIAIILSTLKNLAKREKANIPQKRGGPHPDLWMHRFIMRSYAMFSRNSSKKLGKERSKHFDRFVELMLELISGQENIKFDHYIEKILAASASMRKIYQVKKGGNLAKKTKVAPVL